MAVLVKECHPGPDGIVHPPQLIEHEGQQYALKRQWMQDVYVYSPSARKRIDDFLGNTPTQ
jgi:hypothetical protein